MKPPRFKMWAPLLLLLAAALIRFHDITGDSLWVDEGFTVRLASLPIDELCEPALQDSQPVYNFLLHFWIRWFGAGEAAVRTLSILLNLATLPVLFALVARLAGRREALIAGTIFALASFQVHFALEVRTYSLLGLASTLSVYCFTMLEDRSRAWSRAAYLASTLLMVYSHAYGWFVWCFQLSWALLNIGDKPYHSGRWWRMQALFLVLCIPEVWRMLPILGQVHEEWWLKPPTLLHVPATFLQFSGSMAALILFSIAGGVALVFRFRNGDTEGGGRPWLFFLLWALIPVMVPFLISLAWTPMFLPRYSLAAAIPLYALVAMSVGFLPSSAWRNVLLLCVIAALLHGLFMYKTHETREPWRDMVQDLKGEVEQDDIVLLVMAGRDARNLRGASIRFLEEPFSPPDVFIYYADPFVPLLAGVDGLDVRDPARGGRLARRLASTGQVVWFVDSHFAGYREQFMAILSGEFRLEQSRHYPHRDLYGREVDYLTVHKLTSSP